VIFRTHSRIPLWCNHEVWLDLDLHSNNWKIESFIGFSYKEDVGFSRCWKSNHAYIPVWQAFPN